MTRYLVGVAVVGVLATGCKKKEEAASTPAEGSGAAAGATAPKTAAGAASDSNFPPAFQAWDVAARRAAWQGAWAGDGGALGWKAAWQIDGDKITYADKKGEKQLTFKLESPCSAAFVEKSADGSSSSTISVFTLQNGQLITGLGDAGSRKGDQAVVCGGGKIFTVDAKGCTEWENNFDRLESKPGDCGFKKEGDKEVFHYKANGMDSTLLVDGDVIWSDQLKTSHATKQPDLAAAKKAQGL